MENVSITHTHTPSACMTTSGVCNYCNNSHMSLSGFSLCAPGVVYSPECSFAQY